MSVSYEIIIISSLFQIGWIQVALVADSSHREKTFIIEKSLSESRKKFWNPEKYFRAKKKNEIERKRKRNREKKNLKSRKIFRNQKKILESRKMFQNRGNCFRIEKYFVTKIEKKSFRIECF